MSKWTNVTAIIPSYPQVDALYLKLCVESLRKSGFDGDITVVTNGDKNTQPLADEDIHGITKSLHIRDQGQCAAVNAGASVVEGACQWLFIVNSDMYFAPHWDEYLRFDHLVFSPNLVEPLNNPGSAAPFHKCDGGFTLDEFDRDLVNQNIKALREKGVEESGFNLPFFIKREVWNTIGGYDTAYDPWGSNSDTDLQTKINLAGITPMRLRDVLVYHFSNKSGTFDGTHQEDWQRNWNHFNDKWGFNRDELKSDVWYNKDMLPDRIERIKYIPEWLDKYAE